MGRREKLGAEGRGGGEGVVSVCHRRCFLYIYIFFFMKRWRAYESLACCGNTHGGLGRYNIAPLRATALLSLVVVVVYILPLLPGLRRSAFSLSVRLCLYLCQSACLSVSSLNSEATKCLPQLATALLSVAVVVVHNTTAATEKRFLTLFVRLSVSLYLCPSVSLPVCVSLVSIH